MKGRKYVIKGNYPQNLEKQRKCQFDNLDCIHVPMQWRSSREFITPDSTF